MDIKELPDLLRSVFGSHVSIASTETLNESSEYCVLRLRLTRPDITVIAKLAGANAEMGSPFERTKSLHDLVRSRTGVPVAEVAAASEEIGIWPWKYIVLLEVAGEEWGVVRQKLPKKERNAALGQIGAAVGQLHSIRLESFGHFMRSGKVLSRERFFPALEERAKESIRSPFLNTLFRGLLNERKSLFEGVREPTLCHDDLNCNNLIFTKEGSGLRLASILDFDKAWAGAGEADLARLEFWDGMTDGLFWASYLSHTRVFDGYEQRRPYYQLLWCLEYAAPTARHIADTRKLCKKLGLKGFKGF